MPALWTAARIGRNSRLRFPTQVRYRSYHGRRQLEEARKILKVSEEVQDAVASSKPVVALETTIYTHGFPYPENVALASRLESIVRRWGAVPATIGVLNGVARVGMAPEDLAELASSSQNQEVLKVSRRDLGYICGLGMAGKRMNGGTTIAGTAVLAHLAGIKVFATGGLGGVHRGGESTMDISADLTELGRTPIALISSGCKSFLDIRRTLEYLETEGVLVGTFADGRVGSVDFPAFYTRDSGIKTPKVIHDEVEAAAIIYAQSRLNMSSGMVFANPVPEKFSFPKQEVDHIIEQALEFSQLEGIYGSDNTPFILSKIKELSGGKSVAANTALVEYNVERGTKVAVELAKLEAGRSAERNRHMPGYLGTSPRSPGSPTTGYTIREQSIFTTVDTKPAQGVADKTNVLVAGSLAIDLACDYTPLSKTGGDTPALHTSNPSVISQSLGGVGHNVALAASYVGSPVLLCSIVADDLSGRAALAAIEKSRANIHSQGIQILSSTSGVRTAQYVSINDAKRDLMLAMADMSIMETPEKSLDFGSFWDPLVQRARPKWVVVDANWSPDVLSKWISLAKSHGAKTAFEPVSTTKSARLFTKSQSTSKPVIQPSSTIPNHTIDLATPNRYELAAMYTAARDTGLFESAEWWRVINALEMPSSGSRDRLIALTNSELVNEGIPQQSIQLLPFIPCIISKLGPQGVLLTQLLSRGDERLRSADFAQYILGRAYADDTNPVGGVYMRLFPQAEVLRDTDVVSVNGAGDTLLGVIVAGLARLEETNNGELKKLEDIIAVAQKASVETLKSANAVSDKISDLGKLLQII
ncbi:hypothetical protein PABG_01620 [Paracoccidioides brasiliensis Pb03]|nr:hypothetical protein PABG_01620 [Paracoccidioides brasiliensis Pb03]